MGRNYAESLSKSYLEYLGITHVSKDGKEIWKGDKLMSQYDRGDGYLQILLYDPLKRQQIPAELRTNSSGGIIMGVHRVVYVWYNNFIPSGMVVDHLNNCKSDNRLNNLQLLTPAENTWKERECHKYEMTCKLNKPREFYENKLAWYEEQYEAAKLEHNAERVHKLRSNISQARARLRYWDSHKEEALNLLSERNIEMEAKEAKKALKRDIEILTQYKILAKEKGDTVQWHQLCKCIKHWKEYDPTVRENIMSCVLKHANRY